MTHEEEIVKFIKKRECSEPLAPGMYLRLLHGRSDPKQQMEDWGDDGPCLGPFDWIRVTYNSTIGFGAGEFETGPLLGGDDPIYFHNDMLFYDDMYYGDWEVFVHPGNS